MNKSESTKRYRDYLDCEEPSKSVYAAIGKLVNHFAKLEVELDTFILKASKVDSAKALIKNYYKKMPNKQFGEMRKERGRQGQNGKIEFVIDLFVVDSRFRRVGVPGAYFSVNDFYLCFEEVWSVRNIIIHSDFHFTKHWGDTFYIKGTKWGRDGGEFQEFSTKIGRGYLLKIYDDVSYLRSILRNWSRVLEGRKVWEEYDEMRKQNDKGIELYRELRRAGFEFDRDMSFLHRDYDV